MDVAWVSRFSCARRCAVSGSCSALWVPLDLDVLRVNDSRHHHQGERHRHARSNAVELLRLCTSKDIIIASIAPGTLSCDTTKLR